MLVTNLLSVGNWIPCHKTLSKRFGLECAAIIGLFSQKQEQFNGAFYLTTESSLELREFIGVGERTLRTRIATLKEEGIVATEQRGMPCKTYYLLDEELLLNILNETEDTYRETLAEPEVQNLQDRTCKICTPNKVLLLCNNTIFNNNNTPTHDVRKEVSCGSLQLSKKLSKHKKLINRNKKITPSQFEKFWEAYPKKSSMGAAKSAWEKLCRKNNRPTFKAIMDALTFQKTSERWKDPTQTYIKLPSTWLNNFGWLDDPKDMTLYNIPKKSSIKASEVVNTEFKKELKANLKNLDNEEKASQL